MFESVGEETRLDYPVIITEQRKDMFPFYALLPDFDVTTQGRTKADMVKHIKNLILLEIKQRIKEMDTIPKPNSIPYFLKAGETVMFVGIKVPEGMLAVKEECFV